MGAVTEAVHSGWVRREPVARWVPGPVALVRGVLVRQRKLAMVALLLLTFVAGLGTAAAVRSWQTPGDASPEVGFARDMSVHHQQAVYMSLTVLRRTTNPDVRILAQQMIMTQQSEIGTMASWLRNWGVSPTTDRAPMSWMRHRTDVESPGQMPGMASAADLERLRTADGSALDIAYAQLLTRHHLGGIHMVDGVLASSDRAEVRELAISMRNVQQREITELELLLQRLGTTPLPTR